MEFIKGVFNDYGAVLLVSSMALLLIVFIWNIILTVQMGRLQNKYKRFMRSTTGKNLEGMLEEYIKDVESAIGKVEVIENNISSLKDQAERCIQKCSVARYNAFSDTGSDLSYSIALLDNYNNGVVLTGIYGRNETINYVKPISMGTSSYPLSVEEQMVLDRCTKKANK